MGARLQPHPTSFFPLLVLYEGDEEATVVYNPTDLFTGASFVVLQTKYED